MQLIKQNLCPEQGVSLRKAVSYRFVYHSDEDIKKNKWIYRSGIHKYSVKAGLNLVIRQIPPWNA